MFLLGKHDKMNKEELEAEGCRIADEIIDTANEIDPYASIPEILDVIDVLKNKIADFESASHHWYRKYNNEEITSATKIGNQKLYKVTAGFDDGGPEDGPIIDTEVEFIYADSEEDAIEQYEEELKSVSHLIKDSYVEGYCGCSATEATPQEVAEYEAYLDERDKMIVDYIKEKVAMHNFISTNRIPWYVGECIKQLKATDEWAYDTIADWLESGQTTYWMTDEVEKELFDSGYPDSVIEDVCLIDTDDRFTLGENEEAPYLYN